MTPVTMHLMDSASSTAGKRLTYKRLTGKTDESQPVDSFQGRWIDKTWAAIVTVEEAGPSQREEFHRWVSPERLTHILTSERAERTKEVQLVSVEYDNSNPDRYDEGIFVGIVVRQERDRIKVVFLYKEGGQEIAWLTRHKGRAPIFPKRPVASHGTDLQK